MQSSIIGKVEKAKNYAREPERVTFTSLEVNFRGENDTHTTGYCDGKWHCSCRFFAEWAVCSHTMALEKILSSMLPAETLNTEFLAGL
jgi:hypothetical protein